MTESELRARLRAIASEVDPAVEERAWEVVRIAHVAAPGPRPRRRRGWRMTVPAVAAVLALAAGTLAAARTPRAALGRWLRDAIGLSATPHTRPLLAGLPGGGELLINSSTGPWIVRPAGRRRYLGSFTAAAWSPHSLYVIAWRRRQLDALSPLGQRQWTLTGARTITVARWSPDGYRIAYLDGRALWVVAGDGTGNHFLHAGLAAAAPAWQPDTGIAHRIALIDRSGQIRLLDADSGAQLWRRRAKRAVRQLLWSSDGTRLLSVSADRLDLYDSRGRLLAAGALPAHQSVGQAAFAPRGDRVALALRQAGRADSSIGLLSATHRGLKRPPQILFSARAQLNEINWSPDGRWLLTSSPSADQWIFIRTEQPVRLQAIGRITAQFGSRSRAAHGFPTLGGWQSPPPAQSGH